MPNLALFDFDGTISFGDTFTPFVHLSVSPARLAVGKVVLSPFIVGYKLGFVPARFLRTCIVWLGFRGLREVDVWRAGVEYSRTAIVNQIRPKALEPILWHKSQGDRIAVVSASLDVYLSDWCSQHGLELLCNKLESNQGILTGRYLGRDCSCLEKAERILKNFNLQEFSVVYAYGDTKKVMKC